MKSYTDLEQSKKLAGILPLESADMWYHGHGSPLESEREYDNDACPFHSMRPNWDKPSWSLTALLGILNFPGLVQENKNKWEVSAFDYNNSHYLVKTASNPVDACVKMIEKLHELKML